jgi:G:T-mismatch repair DNA endonuclease (very short patch repair protein)
LEKLGWSVDEVWQCEIKDNQTLRDRLKNFLGPTKAIDIP